MSKYIYKRINTCIKHIYHTHTYTTYIYGNTVGHPDLNPLSLFAASPLSWDPVGGCPRMKRWVLGGFLSSCLQSMRWKRLKDGLAEKLCCLLGSIQ